MVLPPVTGHFHDVIFLKLGVVGQVAVGNGIKPHPLVFLGDASATDELVVFGADRGVSLDRDKEA
jgi:hypothetical protein